MYQGGEEVSQEIFERVKIIREWLQKQGMTQSQWRILPEGFSLDGRRFDKANDIYRREAMDILNIWEKRIKGKSPADAMADWEKTQEEYRKFSSDRDERWRKDEARSEALKKRLLTLNYRYLVALFLLAYVMGAQFFLNALNSPVENIYFWLSFSWFAFLLFLVDRKDKEVERLYRRGEFNVTEEFS